MAKDNSDANGAEGEQQRGRRGAWDTCLRPTQRVSATTSACTFTTPAYKPPLIPTPHVTKQRNNTKTLPTGRKEPPSTPRSTGDATKTAHSTQTCIRNEKIGRSNAYASTPINTTSTAILNPNQNWPKLNQAPSSQQHPTATRRQTDATEAGLKRWRGIGARRRQPEADKESLSGDDGKRRSAGKTE